MYERVIREATRPEDLRSYLNGAGLCARPGGNCFCRPGSVGYGKSDSRLSVCPPSAGSSSPTWIPFTSGSHGSRCARRENTASPWPAAMRSRPMAFLTGSRPTWIFSRLAAWEASFLPVAVDAVIQEFGRDGLVVDVEIRDASFARLSVASDSELSKVEMGVDWRQHSPVQLAIGPVLDADDAVANKVCALFGRAEVRDYVDVDAILASGRYTKDDLLALAGCPRRGLPVRLFQP